MKPAIAVFDPVSSGEMIKSRAKELGYSVVGVFTRSVQFFEEVYHTSEVSLFKDCDEIIVSEDKNEIVQKLKGLPIKAAIAATEGGVEMADEVAHALHLWCNSFECSTARRNKWEMRKLLKKSGLSCPDFTFCSSEKEAVEFAKTHPFPLIIKPPKGVMTSQVYECGDINSLIENFHKIYGNPDIYGNVSTGCVLEEYIAGNEYIVDTFVDGENVHVTDVWIYEKIQTQQFKNIYYNIISIPLDDPVVRPLIDIAISITKLYGITKGPAHLEIKDDPVRGPTLIEIGARLPGVRIPELLKKYTNFDPYKALIEVFVHGKVPLPKTIVFQKHLAIAFFPLMEGGRIKHIHGIEKMKDLPSYDSHILSIHKGDFVPPSTHIATNPLLAFFAHADRDVLLKDVSKAHALFKVEFE